jgi:hypothetical protein
MTQEHPITPPPELVVEWADTIYQQTECDDQRDLYVATQAARWGADQELEACINYFHEYDPSWGEASELITGLRAARRPKPLSLKEKALLQLDTLNADLGMHGLGCDLSQIRRALESLPE